MKKQNKLLVKFTVMTMLLGFFSPSVTVRTVTSAQTYNSHASTQKQFTFTLLHQAEARRGGGTKRAGTRSRSRGGSKNINRNVNKNVNKNVNINRNVNVNVNHRYYGGSPRHHHGHFHGRPIIPFAAGLAIGSIIAASTIPSSCTTVSVRGVAYRKCHNEYYQPFYEGDTLVYKRVSSPY